MGRSSSNNKSKIKSKRGNNKKTNKAYIKSASSSINNGDPDDVLEDSDFVGQVDSTSLVDVTDSTCHDDWERDRDNNDGNECAGVACAPQNKSGTQSESDDDENNIEWHRRQRGGKEQWGHHRGCRVKLGCHKTLLESDLVPSGSEDDQSDEGGGEPIPTKVPSKSKSMEKPKSQRPKRKRTSSAAFVTPKHEAKTNRCTPKSKTKPTKQVSLGFERVRKDPVGMKFLLDDSVYEKKSEIPNGVVGMLFEYQVTKVEAGGMVRAKFNNLVIERNGDRYRTFREHEGEETMSLLLSRVWEAQELWEKHLGRVNARLHVEKECLCKKQNPDEVDGEVKADVSDIFVLYKVHGKGRRLLEIEFRPVTELPEDYETKKKLPSQQWKWKHCATGHDIVRFASANGKTFDSGKLSAYLKTINKVPNPISYQRAKLILSLNTQHRNDPKSTKSSVDDSHC